MGDNPFQNVGGGDRAGLYNEIKWSWQWPTHEIYITDCITNVQV